MPLGEPLLGEDGILADVGGLEPCASGRRIRNEDARGDVATGDADMLRNDKDI